MNIEGSVVELPIKNRIVAGQALARALESYRNRENVLILGLPRGGVTLAYEVARELNALMDLILVRKLGTPGQEELAMGAIASGGIRVLNENIVSSLYIPDEVIEEVATAEQQELERRERAYRGNRPRPEVTHKHVILVDDGLATGATMRAAIAALRQQKPASIVVAVPVAPFDTVEKLNSEADEVICLATPEPFMAIGNWYVDFSQVSDEEVKRLLSKAWTLA